MRRSQQLYAAPTPYWETNKQGREDRGEALPQETGRTLEVRGPVEVRNGQLVRRVTRYVPLTDEERIEAAHRRGEQLYALPTPY